MICMGDFNAILSGDDRKQGRPVQEVEIKDFNDFMMDAGMTEMKATGRDFTWSNGNTCSKIDRAVVNAEWMLNMSQLEVNVIHPGTSDHTPLSLELDKSAGIRHRAFKFFNCIADHPEFITRVEKVWYGGQKRNMN